MSKDDKKDFMFDWFGDDDDKDSDKGKYSDENSDSGKEKNDKEFYSDVSDLGEEKYIDSDRQKKPEKSRRNEVRKEFTNEFIKKKAKYIPPKIKFQGNLTKRSILREKDFEGKFVSNLTLFKDYILITVDSELHFYNKMLELVFKHKFTDEKNEVLSLNPINDETIIMGAYNNLQVINFYEKEKNKITFEIIQEIKETEFYSLNEKLHNGYILIGGMDRKFGFYEIQKKNAKISKNNKIQLKFKIHKVHNVYDDDSPGIADLNNGRILSWLIDDKNIKVIQYNSRKPRIIKSMNGYGLHNAELINDNYLLLMGLIYPKYYTWLMDTETLEIIYKWKTYQNDSFMCTICENKYIYASETRFVLEEFSIKDGNPNRTKIYGDDFIKNMKDNDWEEGYGIRYFLDENTFAAFNLKGRLMIFKCEKD